MNEKEDDGLILKKLKSIISYKLLMEVHDEISSSVY